jgi:hypothetical protein
MSRRHGRDDRALVRPVAVVPFSSGRLAQEQPLVAPQLGQA